MNTEISNETMDSNTMSQESEQMMENVQGEVQTTMQPQETTDLIIPSGVETQMTPQQETPSNGSVEVQSSPIETNTSAVAGGTVVESIPLVEDDPLGLNDGRYTADEITELPQIIKVIDKKSSKKKIIFIIVGIILVIAIAAAVFLFVFNKPKKKQSSAVQEKVISNDSVFVKTIKQSLESGDFSKEIQKGLVENAITTDSVYLISLDIDSDGDQEIIVYAEDSEKKYILQLEVDEDVSYDDSYPVDAKDSIGYAYSSERKETLWYTEYSKNYTIISSTKKIIKEDDFLENYFALTKTYEDKPVLTNAIEYKLDKKLDAEKLEKEAITNDDLLKDNKIDKEDIKDLYSKYLKEKEEEEKKKKEEEEEKAKQEEEARKLSGNLKLGNSSYRFGTYNVYSSDGSLDGTLILYGDLTCVHKGIDCTYTVGEVRGTNDTLVPGISLSTGQVYITSSKAGELTNADESVSIQYAS